MVRDLESVVLFNGRRTGEKDRKEEGKEIAYGGSLRPWCSDATRKTWLAWWQNPSSLYANYA